MCIYTHIYIYTYMGFILYRGLPGMLSAHDRTVANTPPRQQPARGGLRAPCQKHRSGAPAAFGSCTTCKRAPPGDTERGGTKLHTPSLIYRQRTFGAGFFGSSWVLPPGGLFCVSEGMTFRVRVAIWSNFRVRFRFLG